MCNQNVLVRMVFLWGTLAAGATVWGAAPDVAEVEKRFGPRVMKVAKPPTPPAIDGKLDDPVWRAAPPVTLGFTAGAWDMPTQKTEARVLADARAIYFAVRCFEAHPEQMLASEDARDGRPATGDTVEFFLDPWRTGKSYFHICINPKGFVKTAIYHGRGSMPRPWKAPLVVKTGTFASGWTVAAAVPLQDLGISAGGIPKVWGLNINRQRPELGVVLPKAAAGAARLNPQLRKLDEPDKYRDGELSAWSPTWSDYNYDDSRPFHFPKRFGHALLEVGTKEVNPPEKLFEVLYRSDFDSGRMGPFKNAVWRDESFRGPGKCLASAKHAIHFTQGLEDLEDVTMILTFKMPSMGSMYYYGRALDGTQCGADRHEVFLTHEAAKIRAADPRQFPTLDWYDTHADKMAWKPWGRLWKGPGPWAMMTGYFAEPTAGSVGEPGTDWVILRTRLGLFRRYPGTQPRPAQGLVPISQNYPEGLVFFANAGPLLIGDLVVFRGVDVEPPEQVKGVTLKRQGEELAISWQRARDNTLTAYYRVFTDKKQVAQTHRLSTRLKPADIGSAAITVVAYDLCENASKPSEPVMAPKRR